MQPSNTSMMPTPPWEAPQPDAAPSTSTPPAETSAWEAMQSEVEAESSTDQRKRHAVKIAGREIHVLDPVHWRQGAREDLNNGDFDGWARRVLTPDEYENVWLAIEGDDEDDVGPSMGEILEMFDTFNVLTQDSLGKQSSSRSSRRAARR